MRYLPINLDELAFVLHRSAELRMECFLHLKTGSIINIPTDTSLLEQVMDVHENIDISKPGKLLKLMVKNPDDYLHIPNHFSRNIFHIMSEFTRFVETKNQVLSEKLWEVIKSKEGGSQVFVEMIENKPGLFRNYIRFRDLVFEKEARHWLLENDIIVI